jgi:hypothetical protein
MSIAIENPRVDGSIPSQATNLNPSISNVARVSLYTSTITSDEKLNFQAVMIDLDETKTKTNGDFMMKLYPHALTH